LLALAHRSGIDTLALTDINSTAGSLNFVRLSEKYDVRPVLGIDFRNGTDQKFIGLAKNNKGFQELNEYLSYHLHQEIPIPDIAPVFEHAYIIYPFTSCKKAMLNCDEYIGVRTRDFSRLPFSKWRDQQDKLVALQTMTFRSKRDFNAHRLLRAIDKNTLLSKLPKSEEGHVEDCFLSRKQMAEAFAPYPYLLENADKLLSNCTINFEFGDEQEHKNLKTYTGCETQDFKLMKRVCLRGFSYRYPNAGEEIHKRLEKELQIIKQKGFVSYFLINCKIVSYARKKNYFYVGRGSGANSIVAYLMRITDVDPIDLDLYFERFINLYRKNPPDFDIDFSWKDREDVTRFIFEFFTKKAPNRVALLATYSTFQYRATVRELAKVFGLPPHEIDRLSEGKSPTDDLSALVLRYGGLITGFPSHLSIHAGGILIAEQSIYSFTATSMPPKGFPVTHFDMLMAEDVGLYKFDILGQRGLAKIKDCLQVAKDNNPEDPPIDIHDFKKLKEDERIKELLREAQAIGCFYVESPAMRMLLKKLKVDHYLGLVAASSVIRPGVAKSGMMREYILRFRHPERREDAHPVLREIMPETYGVMVYQEDVIKVAHYFAGLDLGEADVLRRGMSGKYRSREEFKKVEEKYFENCKEKGHSFALAKDVWRQIESFAGYAFSKGHSASYAVESYQSLYLKAYYPLEYMVCVVNNGGGFYRRELYLHEARMHGAVIEAPCVNRSEALCSIKGQTIYLGLNFVKELEDRLVNELIFAREEALFRNLGDFVSRVAVSLEQLALLIRIGAFRFTGKTKKELLWEAHFLLGGNKKSKPTRGLFDSPVKKFELPELTTYKHEDSFDEMELLGFPLCNPFELLREPLFFGILAKDFPVYLNKEVTVYGYLVAIKNTSTSKKERMNFGTFIDREGNFIDTVHFPQAASQFPFYGKGIYKLKGKVVEEFEFYSIEVSAMQKLPYIDDPRYVGGGKPLHLN